VDLAAEGAQRAVDLHPDGRVLLGELGHDLAAPASPFTAPSAPRIAARRKAVVRPARRTRARRGDRVKSVGDVGSTLARKQNICKQNICKQNICKGVVFEEGGWHLGVVRVLHHPEEVMVHQHLRSAA
jgi:hypothetical protein